MKLIANFSLRNMLVVPYVVLILLLAVISGALSYHSGRDAIDTWSSQLLIETVERIKQAVDQHVAGSAAVLEVAFPRGVPAPTSFEDSLDSLRTRFWLATSVHRDARFCATRHRAPPPTSSSWKPPTEIGRTSSCNRQSVNSTSQSSRPSRAEAT